MGIYDITRRNYVPDNYLSKPRLDEVMRFYDHRISARTTVWAPVDWFISYDDNVISGLKTAWLKAIRENVIAYVTHRWILFKSFLTDRDGKVNHLYAVSDWHEVMQNPPPLLEETALGKIHTAYVNGTYKLLGFLFKAYFWLIISFVLLGYAIRRKVLIVGALASSSLLYFAPYFFVAPSVNYRYIYWPVIACVVSIIVIWIETDFVQPGVTRNKN